MTAAGLCFLTQNVWGGVPFWPARRELLARRIASLRPDVIGLQEVHAPHARGDESQAHELAALVGGYHAIFAPARVTELGACEGVALLCRSDVHEHSIEALTLDPSDRFEGANRRVVLNATFEHEGTRVDAFVTHLSLSRTARTRTAAELIAFCERERLRSSSTVAILMGDFNATPDEPAVDLIEQAWVDAWKLAPDATGRGGTWPALLPFRRLDYLFVQPAHALHVRSCTRVPYSGSDHLGLLARIELG